MIDQDVVEAAMTLIANNLMESYDKRISHCKPMIRNNLNAGYRQGVIDALKTLDQINQERNTVRSVPDVEA